MSQKYETWNSGSGLSLMTSLGSIKRLSDKIGLGVMIDGGRKTAASPLSGTNAQTIHQSNEP